MLHKHKCFAALFVVLLFVVLAACDKMLPEEFRQKEFNISQLGSTACSMMTQELVSDPDSMNYAPVNAGTMEELLGGAIQGKEDSLVSVHFDELADAAEPLSGETVSLVQYSPREDTVYASFIQEGSASDVYFFISWELTQANVGGYISVEIFNSGGKVNVKDQTMPLETVAYCTQTYQLDSGAEAVASAIKTQVLYHLNEGSHLVRFFLSQPGVTGPFRVAIIHP